MRRIIFQVNAKQKLLEVDGTTCFGIVLKIVYKEWLNGGWVVYQWFVLNGYLMMVQSRVECFSACKLGLM